MNELPKPRTNNSEVKKDNESILDTAKGDGKSEEKSELENIFIEEIRKIYDPELPVNIYELGLIYDVKVIDSKVEIKMTLTTPNCPVAESLPKDVKDSAMQVKGVEEVDLQLVWDPPWNKDMMSDAAKLELNL